MLGFGGIWSQGNVFIKRDDVTVVRFRPEGRLWHYETSTGDTWHIFTLQEAMGVIEKAVAAYEATSAERGPA